MPPLCFARLRPLWMDIDLQFSKASLVRTVGYIKASALQRPIDAPTVDVLTPAALPSLRAGLTIRSKMGSGQFTEILL